MKLFMHFKKVSIVQMYNNRAVYVKVRTKGLEGDLWNTIMRIIIVHASRTQQWKLDE